MLKILAKIFHTTGGRLISIFTEVYFNRQIKKYKDGVYKVYPNPPYISQLANADQGKIDGYYQTIHDKQAMKQFGASSIEDFSYWAWRACGIAGIQMILNSKPGNRFNKSTMELISEGLSLKGYDIRKDKGWYHKSLLMLGQRYGLEGKLVKFVPVSQIASFILKGNYVLASIKSLSGGHLLLVHGVRVINGNVDSFIVHDPYSFVENGDSKELTRKTFERVSTRRVIVFRSGEWENVRTIRI